MSPQGRQRGGAVEGRALTIDQNAWNHEEAMRVEDAGGMVEPPPGYIQPRLWRNQEHKGPGLQMLRALGDHASRDIGVIPDPVRQISHTPPIHRDERASLRAHTDRRDL